MSIIGASGCGKSTTMLITAGLMPATEGDIFFRGERLDRPLTDIGIVFQDHLLLDFRTAIDNVMLQQKIRRLDPRLTRARADELFDKLNLSGAENRYPSQLVRRHAPARLDRSRAGARTFDPDDGRAVRRARRHHAQPDPL